MRIVGLDIGGANIKAADERGQTLSRPFAIWRHPERLTEEVQAILQNYPGCDQIALTMTAELADCFVTKAEGVRSILRSVEDCLRDPEQCVGQSATAPERLMVWTTRGHFVDTATARIQTESVAAAVEDVGLKINEAALRVVKPPALQAALTTAAPDDGDSAPSADAHVETWDPHTKAA